MKASFFFSPCEDSTRITLSDTFQLNTEKNTLPFLGCPPLMFSAPQYPVVPAGCSKRDAPVWMPGPVLDNRIADTGPVSAIRL
ncbi:hypothetical protein TNCV_805431 [Trichonephila clavipes]|nr:hypothetical protein TNCV_805431 [Trichonephila clavipes]